MTEVSTTVQKNGDRRANLGDALSRQAARNPHKTAVIGYDLQQNRRTLTYAELDRYSDRLAADLAAASVTQGSVVAMMSNNRIEFVVGYYGSLKAGACFTGISPALTDRELEFQLEHAEPSVIIAHASDGPRIRRLGGAARVVEFTGEGDPAFTGLPPAPAALDVDVDETDLALIVYTSGTEDTPKGVLIPHRNFLIATTPSWVIDGYIEATDVFLLLAPVHTMAGVGTVTNLMSIGATMVVTESVKADIVIEIIEADGVTNTSQTPTFYSQMISSERFASADLSSLRQCHTYGGSIPQPVIEAFTKHSDHVEWATYWGQSELSQLGVVGFYHSLDDIPERDLRWIGRPMSAVEVRVVDENGEEAPVGELLCRSPGIMTGYHKDDALTAETVVDGWLRTGDIVRMDSNSNLFFYDRKKDIIKSGGMNVSSLEVETVLKRHPIVDDAAVVGLPDEYWSEAVTAFVVLKGGAAFDEASLIDACKEDLAPYKIPKSFVVIDGLPRDKQGKVVKRRLRDGNLGRPT